MIGTPILAVTGDDAARLVRALGRHRYVASRLHLVHALVYAALSPEECANEALIEGSEWARRALSGPLDRSSRDERLWRKADEAEVAALLAIYWSVAGGGARARLEAELETIGGTLEGTPFDEAGEDGMFPVLIDCGWELLPLADLDPARHKGAIDAFGAPLAFEVAKFEEDATNEGQLATNGPRAAYLHELSAIGPAELLRGVDEEGFLIEPLVVWQAGPEPYLDYVLRGALKSAKLEAVDD